MLKRALLRQARLGRPLGASRVLFKAARGTTALPSAKLLLPWSSSSRAFLVAPSITSSPTSRPYSNVAAAQLRENNDQQPSPDGGGELSEFADLAALGVHRHLVSAITDKMQYQTMTDVQKLTIRPALAGKDIVAQAKTGTGKTLAFLIPIVQRMLAEDENLAWRSRVRARSDDIRAIILSPTRELAEQIGEEARRLCQGTGVKVQTAVGGTQKRMMLNQARRQGCHLLVATPGRLLDLLSDENSGIDAPMLSSLVLDEADRMLEVGFDKELREILRLLPDRTQKARQTLLFSATIPHDVISLARSYVDASNFEFVQTTRADETPTHEKVPQYIVPVRGYANLFPSLLELLDRDARKANEPGEAAAPLKALVFLQTTSMVQLAKVAFERLQRHYPSLPPMHNIHSKLTQSARTQAAQSFRAARSAILFSSDVTARGMDFPNVSHVIQLGVPSSREQYIHRVGRTGRANKGGEAWLLVPQDDVDFARRTLPGLPIERAKGLESADYDVGGGGGDGSPPAPLPVTHVSDAMGRLPAGLLVDTYMSYLGGVTNGRDKQTFVDNLNDWTRLGWGWDAPPAISRQKAAKLGLLRLRGLRIGDEPRAAAASSGRDEGRGGGYRDRDGPRRRFGRPRGGGDKFDAIQQQSSRSERSERYRPAQRATF